MRHKRVTVRHRAANPLILTDEVRIVLWPDTICIASSSYTFCDDEYILEKIWRAYWI